MKKVLIAEDSSVIQNLAKKILEFQNFQIHAVKNGQQVLDELAKAEFDIILLDINMPNINGYQVVKQVKNNPLTKNIPIIILSGLTEESDKEFGLRIGADHYLTKPIMPDEIERTIKQYLGH